MKGQYGSKGLSFSARTIEVPEDHAGRRLDKFIQSQLRGVPATLLFRLMREGKIRVNGHKVKQNHRIEGADSITLPAITVEETKEPQRVPQHLLTKVRESIVFENDDLIAVNKPAGLAVHRGTGVDAGVIEALRFARPDIKELELAHRIDRETSGLLLVAKTSTILRHLQEILREEEHRIKRYYLAHVDGYWPTDLTVSHQPLHRTHQRTVVAPHGLRAETRFAVVKRHGQGSTTIEAQLLTGRKHQIRVHCADAGHPIGGDSRYGSDAFNKKVRGRGVKGMLLHAHRVDIPMPDGNELTLTAPTPAEWEKLQRN